MNVRAVWGSVVSGDGLAHMNEFLSTLDSPTLSSKTCSTIENQVSQWWKDLLEEDFSSAIEEEKRIGIKKRRFHEGWYIYMYMMTTCTLIKEIGAHIV